MKNSLVPSVLLSSVIFVGLTLPLATAGSQPLEIKLQKEQVFVGTLRDIATPYLGLAGLISVGAGMINLSVAGWRNSSRKSTQIDNQMSKLQTELQRKETQIEDLRLSVPYLKATGLDAFLEPNPAMKAQEINPMEVPSATAEMAQLDTIQIQSQATPLVQSSTAQHQIVKPAISAPINPPLAVVNSFEPALPAIASASIATAPTQPSDSHAEVVIAQMNELKQQLQQMAAQVAMLQQQTVVQTPPPAPKPVVQQEAPVSSGQIIEHLHRRLQHLESDWLRQKVAS